ncbi:MarR family winged helix-turn-helix transcriptional regulator [Streptacidiphilus griseoplanus]|uniref:MarR family winged helix-turn-helix transcriptional regulator n=1 Tax=Peterkaempfera griseoplana TaxID=66896 RepID=UPI0006E182F6|nr:MarR family transcriptional regulator [Peterkaempfera griseoplana]
MNLAELHLFGRALSAAAVHAMQPTGSVPLSPTELVVLRCLHDEDGLAVGELARRCGFAQSRISTVVAELRERGLLEVVPDPRDRRRNLVSTTARLRELATSVPAVDATPLLHELLGAAGPRAGELVAALGEAAAALAAHTGEPQP